MEKEDKITLQKKIKNIEKKTVVYLGPSIPNIVAENSIFRGELPEKIQNIQKELPVIKILFVPIEKLIAAKKELTENNSAKAICYNKVLEYRKENMNE